MKIHEYQAKELFRNYGVPVPAGALLFVGGGYRSGGGSDSRRCAGGQGANPRRRAGEGRRREGRPFRRRGDGRGEANVRHESRYGANRRGRANGCGGC